MRMEAIVDPERLVSISERQRSVFVFAQALMMAWLTASEWRVTSLRVFLRFTMILCNYHTWEMFTQITGDQMTILSMTVKDGIEGESIAILNCIYWIQFASHSGILIYFERMDRITARPGSDCELSLIANVDNLGELRCILLEDGRTLGCPPVFLHLEGIAHYSNKYINERLQFKVLPIQPNWECGSNPQIQSLLPLL